MHYEVLGIFYRWNKHEAEGAGYNSTRAPSRYTDNKSVPCVVNKCTHAQVHMQYPEYPEYHE